MRKKIDNKLEEINRQIDAEREKRRSIDTNKAAMLENARAELATIEGKETLYLEEKSEEELDALMMRKAALQEKIKILAARVNLSRANEPDAKEAVKDIFLRTDVLDNESEDWARSEIKEHLLEIEAILNIRKDERERLTEARSRATNIYNVSQLDNCRLFVGKNTDTLQLKTALDRDPAFKRLTAGIIN